MWKNLKMQLTFVAGLGPWTTVPEAKIAVILLIRQHSGLINAYIAFIYVLAVFGWQTWLTVWFFSFPFLLSVCTSVPLVMVKQEHRDELDLPAVPPISMPRAPAGSLVRTQLPSPELGHPSDNLLSSSPHGLATGSGPGLLPVQTPCPSLGSPSFQHLPQLQGRILHHPPADCQMTYHPNSAPLSVPPHSSYQPMQHSHGHSLPFNGQPSLSPQGYERMPFQQSPSATSHPMGMGMLYPSSPCSSPTAPSSSTTNPIEGSPQSQQPLFPPSCSHLQTLGSYHCSPTQVPSPGGHPLTGQHSTPLQRAMGYHPVSQRSASCPTTSSAPPPRMVPSPHSGPPSPQLHSLPYQSPTSSSPTSGGSPLGPLQQQHSGQLSPQATSPVMTSLSPAGVGPLVHPLSPQGPFQSDGERLSIKQEPEDREPTFRSIGLQDITLDDGEMYDLIFLKHFLWV